MNDATLLPTGEGFAIEKITSQAQAMLIHVKTTASEARCPGCGHLSQQIHSRYQRTLADLPWNRVAVRLRVQARKFVCERTDCPHRIFTEPLPDLAQRYARKTQRLQAALYLIGYALGGEAGARVAVGLGLSVSPDTLLARVRQASTAAADPASVQVLGVDDWAFRKGHRYGTILVDLQRHSPLALLPDREVASLTTWLHAHPSVRLLSRDRASNYAQAAQEGAPQAQQIADRWHLLHNGVQTLATLLNRQALVRREAAQAVQPAGDGRHAPTSNQRQKQARYQRQQQQFAHLHTLLTQQPALPEAELAEQVGISVAQLRRWHRLECLPPPRPEVRQPSMMDPFLPYLKQRWEQGERRLAPLLREIRQQGFAGTAALFYHVLRDWRQPLRAAAAKQRQWVPGPQAVAWWLLGPPGKLKPLEARFVTELHARSPAITTAVSVLRAWRRLVRQRDLAGLDAWLEAAQASGVSEIQQLAEGLVQDRSAVRAALEHPYSNGQTEGQVNRLKLIKRSMYGRAKLDLLQARVLPMRQAA